MQLEQLADINTATNTVVNSKQKVFQDAFSISIVPLINGLVDTININAKTISSSTNFSFAGVTTAEQFAYRGAIDISSTHLDTQVTAGFFAGQLMGGAPGTEWYFITIESYTLGSTITVHQTLTTTTNRIFTRTRSIGVWGTWKELKKIGDTVNVLPSAKISLFGYGYSISAVSVTNKVSSTGVVSADTAGVGTARWGPAACSYGGDKGVFGYGYNGTHVSMTNLVSNTGVVSADIAGVGTARFYPGACSYGGDKGVFGYGYLSSALSMTNLVSNTGVVSADRTSTTLQRAHVAACGYGIDKGIFGYGWSDVGGAKDLSITTLISNTGVVSADIAGVGSIRNSPSACGYGGDKGIFGYGSAAFAYSMTNLVSNTGVVSADIAGVGTARSYLAACGYGGDKGVFGYGLSTSPLSMANLVSNTGVVSADVAGVGTARYYLAAAGF